MPHIEFATERDNTRRKKKDTRRRTPRFEEEEEEEEPVVDNKIVFFLKAFAIRERERERGRQRRISFINRRERDITIIDRRHDARDASRGKRR